MVVRPMDRLEVRPTMPVAVAGLSVGDHLGLDIRRAFGSTYVRLNGRRIPGRAVDLPPDSGVEAVAVPPVQPAQQRHPEPVQQGCRRVSRPSGPTRAALERDVRGQQRKLGVDGIERHVVRCGLVELLEERLDPVTVHPSGTAGSSSHRFGRPTGAAAR